jgi:hypothetical protein
MLGAHPAHPTFLSTCHGKEVTDRSHCDVATTKEERRIALFRLGSLKTIFGGGRKGRVLKDYEI